MKIEVKALSKWYGQVIGVNNLSFTVEPGVTGFLGPNGAGKTTMLRLMTGQMKPSQGQVLINGESIWNHEKINRYLGYCPEQDAFWPYLTGEEFVTDLTQMHGFSKAESRERALEAIQEVGMTEAEKKKIGSYSKGMRQRIKLAQAIAHDPDVLFLDEPLNGMDPLARRATVALIKKLGVLGKAVVVSSHVLHEVEEMTDKIVLINHGRLLAEGDIYEIRKLIDNHPLQVSIRCNQVNVLTAQLLAFDDVQSVEFDREKHQLTVETRNPEAFYQRLPEIVLDNKIDVYSMWSPDENLEAVFDYLVR